MRCRLGRAATGHFGGQRASLYPCAVPVPVRGQYRVLCRSLWCCLPFCPGRVAALVVRLPEISAGKLGIPVFLHCAGSGRGGSTVFSAGACGAHYAARAFRPPAVCLCPPCGAAPCSLLGLAAPIMPPGRVAFFPGKSSLIFRQTRKLYTGSLRNCLPALNRLFFCMSHSLLCDELLHTHLV